MSIKLNDVQQISEIKGKALINLDGKFAQIEASLLKGATGEKGEQGTQGQKGENGITPNITIGTVTTLDAEQQATVTNTGTAENPVFNFGIPKGKDTNITGGTKGQFLVSNGDGTVTWLTVKNGNEVAY